jgi:hypothetical protein
LPANRTSLTDTGLLAATPYEYEVQAFNQFGASPFSGTFTTTTQPIVPPVPYLIATPSGPGMISLAWYPSYANALITGYSLWRKGSGADWAAIAVLPATITSYVDRGLAANTKYTYRIRSFNSAAASLDWSSEATATTPLVPPTGPTGLAATALSATHINLTWSLQTSDETAVEVWRKSGTGAYVAIAFLSPGSTGYSDTTVTSGITYTYRVRTANDIFVSPWSNVASVTPP